MLSRATCAKVPSCHLVPCTTRLAVRILMLRPWATICLLLSMASLFRLVCAQPRYNYTISFNKYYWLRTGLLRAYDSRWNVCIGANLCRNHHVVERPPIEPKQVASWLHQPIAVPSSSNITGFILWYANSADACTCCVVHPRVTLCVPMLADVVVGQNNCGAVGTAPIPTCCPYGFSAAIGFDVVTGLGTPNYLAILNYIQKLN
jgi:hypothetical protein